MSPVRPDFCPVCLSLSRGAGGVALAAPQESKENLTYLLVCLFIHFKNSMNEWCTLMVGQLIHVARSLTRRVLPWVCSHAVAVGLESSFDLPSQALL
jgi:hypothetical protein